MILPIVCCILCLFICNFKPFAIFIKGSINLLATPTIYIYQYKYQDRLSDSIHYIPDCIHTYYILYHVKCGDKMIKPRLEYRLLKFIIYWRRFDVKLTLFLLQSKEQIRLLHCCTYYLLQLQLMWVTLAVLYHPK